MVQVLCSDCPEKGSMWWNNAHVPRTEVGVGQGRDPVEPQFGALQAAVTPSGAVSTNLWFIDADGYRSKVIRIDGAVDVAAAVRIFQDCPGRSESGTCGVLDRGAA